MRDTAVTADVRQTSLEQDAAKRSTKVLVEDGVDGWIESRVHVAEPECDRKERVGNLARRTCRHENVKEEERQPARDKAAHDETEDQRGTFLLFPRYPTLLFLGIARLWLWQQCLI